MPTKQCYYCDAALDGTAPNQTVDGLIYCPTCYSERFASCDECSEIIDRDNLAWSPSDAPLCEDCFQELCVECEHCSTTVWESDSRSGYDGECLCYQCWSDDCDFEWPPEDFAPSSNSYRRLGSRRCYGIELEYRDAPNGRRSHDALQYFGCKDEHCGTEYYSSILEGDRGLAAIENLTSYAVENNWRISTDCGYHLHLDMRNEAQVKLQVLAYAYLKTYRVWARFVDDWRRNRCSFCMAPENTPEQIRAMSDSEFSRWMRFSQRYTFVNWNSYNVHTTVEVRLHHATNDATEITHWVKAHARFVDWALEQSFESIDATFVDDNIAHNFAAIANVWNSPSLRTYYRRRARACGAAIPPTRLQTATT